MTERVLLSFAILCLLVLVGKWVRVNVRWIHRLYLPSSVIAGLLGLLVLNVGREAIPPALTAGWTRLPGILINVVFAALFLGTEIPSLRTVWRESAPQLAYGQIVAWGQYAVGLGLALCVLGPLLGVPAVFGVLIPVGFEGGHGTAAGLRSTFERLGWPEGGDLGLTSATMGIVSAIVVGIALINWAARRKVVAGIRPLDQMSDTELSGIYPGDARPSAGLQTVRADSIDTLALHLAIVGVAILVGMGLRWGLRTALMRLPGESAHTVAASFPLFPLCMIGGIIVQVVISRASRHPLVDAQLMQRCGGTAMDFLVTAAISTISIQAVAAAWVPMVMLAGAGVLWNVLCVVVIAPRMFSNAWFERSICELGQSMGVTATGLLLLRVADPEDVTPARRAFGYKQLLHEPFMGGGLWTSAAIPLVITWSATGVWIISLCAIALWSGFWWMALRPRPRPTPARPGRA